MSECTNTSKLSKKRDVKQIPDTSKNFDLYFQFLSLKEAIHKIKNPESWVGFITTYMDKVQRLLNPSPSNGIDT